MNGTSSTQRIASMDQFRGYTVAGMFLVNFLGSFAVIHPLLKHNQIYFSYADSIMPSFLFAVGFSFRLTWLKRMQQSSSWSTVWTYVRRSLALVVLSLVIAGFGDGFKSWGEFGQMPPQFEPFRPKPARTKSFDFLIEKTRGANPGKDEREILVIARGTGNGQGNADRHKLAKQAARIADDEARDFVAPARQRIQDWQALSPTAQLWVHLRVTLGKLLKSVLWETLAIIGVTQIVVLPFVGRSFLTRFAALVALGGLHFAISYVFNWDFVHGINDSWMAKLWMSGDDRSWDGGFFGPLCWAVSMLAGTLAYDLVMRAATPLAAARRLVVWGVAFMLVGYLMSCLTLAYHLAGPELDARRVEVSRRAAEAEWIDRLQGTDRGPADEREARSQVYQDMKNAIPNPEFADSPVVPSLDQMHSRGLSEWFVEPPFVAPPRDDPKDLSPAIEHRLWNYWMMGKRMPNLSFMTFASGFAFALYGLFVLACDAGGIAVGFFTTFGTNALVAYFLHEVIQGQVKKLVPPDAELWYCLSGFLFFFLLTYACVRYLEKQKIYVKL
jgi:hypothetical protein